MKSIDKFVLVLVASLALLLAGCGGGSSTPEGPTPEEVAAMKAMEMRAMEQKADLEEAHEALTTALAATLNTQDALDAANAAHKTLSDAITAAADVSAADKAKYENAASAAMDRIADAQKIFDAAEVERMAMEQEQQRKEEAAAAAEMAATAAKLYAGIGDNPLLATGDGARSAAYSGTNDADITVTMDDAAEGDGADVTQALKATDMSVAANHGWEGKQYTASGTGVSGTYEAIVYSNVGEPTQGGKFGQIGVTSPAEGYQYGLNAAGMLVITATENTGAKVRGASFDHTSGVKQFKFPSPNPSGVTKVSVPGTFHGVSGTYTCTPGSATCAARKTERGFELGTLSRGSFTVSATEWTFRPSNPEARVTDVPDADYASYGWWIHTAENGTLTASAFVDDKGTAPTTSGVTALQGTATYMGGAAGKYALASSTGGTNDAGHFTARATLEADFGNETALGTITGTIDQFIGADGESRDWSVKLNKSAIADGGAITGVPDTAGTGLDTVNTGDQSTVWTIGGNAAAASGMWSGDLKDTAATATDVSGVPKIATGTFYTEFGTAGRMVGAFGANKE